jgi:hypothetical protein
MVFNVKLFICTLLLLFTASKSTAQPIEYGFDNEEFKRITGSLNVKNALYDAKKVLWLYTDKGIFYHVNGHKNISEVFSANYWNVESSILYEDSKQRIWFANEHPDFKLRFIRNNRVSSILLPFSFRTTCIFESHDGAFWIGTMDNGCIVLRQTDTGEWLYSILSNVNKIPTEVYSIFNASNDDLFLTTRKGLLKWDPAKRQALQMKAKLPGLVQLSYGCSFNDSILLLGTWGNGIYHYNVKTDKLFPGIPGGMLAQSKSFISGISKVDDEVLISTWGHGAIILKGNQVFELNKSSGLISEKVYNTIKGPFSNYLIILKNSGIASLYYPDKIRFQKIIPELSSYNSLLSDSNNNFIATGTGGFEVMSGEGKRTYLESTLNIYGAVRMNDGNYLLATYGNGLLFYNLLKQKKNGQLSFNGKSDFYLSLERDVNNDSLVWAGSLGGVVCVNYYSKETTFLKSFKGHKVNRMKSLPENKLLINTEDSGLFILNTISGVSRRFKDDLGKGIQAKTITTGEDNTIYLSATDGKIYRLVLNSDEVKFLTQTPDSAGVNYLFIKKEMMLAGKEDGLYLYNMRTKNWLGLNHMFGGSFKSGVYPANYSSPVNGKMAFLTSNGICIVSDEVLATQPYYPQFRIDSVFYAGIRADSLQQILDIKYDEAIDFYFSSYSSNFRSTAKIQYRTSDEISWIDLDDSRHLLLSGLSLGSHTIQFRVSADGLNWKEAGDKRTINVSLPWYLSYTFYAYLFIFTAALVFTLYKRRIATIKKEEAAKTKIAMQQAEQEMKVLRAQMNPHFIFNALNSIHNCILQRDTLTAANSLTKFSRLVRKILDNSLHSTISLESELAALELYIQIEQLRFNTKFEYTITVDPAIDPASTMVPPLILQPFVENSIWHGLMPSEKKGSIMVEVSRKGEHLHFTISDNGIGREKAAQLKAKSENQHTSHGIAITRERLNMFNQSMNNSTSFNIIDLYNERDEPVGTKVEFDLVR